MITTFLFDLDGTLLPMDLDVFLKAYMGSLAKKMIAHGYDSKEFLPRIWKGTEAMIKNDGSRSNKEAFWQTFSALNGRDTRTDEPVFLEYFAVEFQQVRNVCGFNPKAKTVLDLLNGKGIRTVLATDPRFPTIATQSRARWAGLEPEDFDLITTYENSRFCKPNLDYYRDILDTLQVRPEECAMVGNHVVEDMVAQQLGMQVFLLTDCLINPHNADISRYPHGNFDDLLDWIGGLDL